MKRTIFILLCFCQLFVSAQINETKIKQRRFFFGVSTGISSIQLSSQTNGNEQQIGLSFPNIKIGRMLNDHSAILLCLPGSIYQEKNMGRTRDRGFEGIIPSYQYWLSDRFWALAGAGLTFDAPAFYDIKDETERKFYFGPSILVGTGYEFYKKGKMTLDIQGRMQYGYSKYPTENRTGLALNLLIGVNWH
jgi:hypothetical protein